jgi:hypothetical protein
MNPDQVNGLFEAVAGLFHFTNCWRLYKDKVVLGYNPWSTVFFTAWGFYNLYFYPANKLPWSFYGGLVVVAANSIWITLAFLYRKNRA